MVRLRNALGTVVVVAATAWLAVRFYDTGNGVFLGWAVAGALSVVAGAAQDVIAAIRESGKGSGQ